MKKLNLLFEVFWNNYLSHSHQSNCQKYILAKLMYDNKSSKKHRPFARLQGHIIKIKLFGALLAITRKVSSSQLPQHVVVGSLCETMQLGCIYGVGCSDGGAMARHGAPRPNSPEPLR